MAVSFSSKDYIDNIYKDQGVDVGKIVIIKLPRKLKKKKKKQFEAFKNNSGCILFINGKEANYTHLF
jgi:hypothetical protein